MLAPHPVSQEFGLRTPSVVRYGRKAGAGAVEEVLQLWCKTTSDGIAGPLSLLESFRTKAQINQWGEAVNVLTLMIVAYSGATAYNHFQGCNLDAI